MNMGSGMNKVIQGLYVGSLKDLMNAEQLVTNGITHILSVHDNAQAIWKDMKYMCIDASDNSQQNLLPYFRESIHFIHEARVNRGNVLVHCVAGVSRSVTLTMAYVMTVTGLGWRDTLYSIRGARRVANPNLGFRKQLQTFESEHLIKEKEKLFETFPDHPFWESDLLECEKHREVYQAWVRHRDEILKLHTLSLPLSDTPNASSDVISSTPKRSESPSDNVSGQSITSAIFSQNWETQIDVDKIHASSEPAAVLTVEGNLSSEVKKSTVSQISETTPHGISTAPLAIETPELDKLWEPFRCCGDSDTDHSLGLIEQFPIQGKRKRARRKHKRKWSNILAAFPDETMKSVPQISKSGLKFQTRDSAGANTISDPVFSLPTCKTSMAQQGKCSKFPTCQPPFAARTQIKPTRCDLVGSHGPPPAKMASLMSFEVIPSKKFAVRFMRSQPIESLLLMDHDPIVDKSTNQHLTSHAILPQTINQVTRHQSNTALVKSSTAQAVKDQTTSGQTSNSSSSQSQKKSKNETCPECGLAGDHLKRHIQKCHLVPWRWYICPLQCCWTCEHRATVIHAKTHGPPDMWKLSPLIDGFFRELILAFKLNHKDDLLWFAQDNNLCASQNSVFTLEENCLLDQYDALCGECDFFTSRNPVRPMRVSSLLHWRTLLNIKLFIENVPMATA